ncbi:C2H2 type zinc-finger-domain-containing protein [Mycotypha africana]|uniref:C2H2 type zinc-finger-domain-containing protein n=1 Tax=Mycotypha africana TaxID=64632 RepID=UPI0023016861|nr:C2H2 type zinc-finger-domain-containing protein [Mycotypha africana]KAI8967457.1 C2H2 type zinc-finger-domain-containing protein [Mycotypha africana]
MVDTANLTASATTLPSSPGIHQIGVQRSEQYTCVACQIAFSSFSDQRNHYHTDWHKYNLKRKVAALSSLTAEQFNRKVLAQQARRSEELEKQDLVYECSSCNKSYYTENAFNNHIQSKKHSDMASKHKNKIATRTSSNSSVLQTSTAVNVVKNCLFCNQTQESFDDNLRHMSKNHGFFIPDIEYLFDCEGLISYLSYKINDQYLCLYCNGRGKLHKSSTAARQHMLDCGHCKMAYDETEDAEELLKYYDFSTEEKDKEGDDVMMDIDSSGLSSSIKQEQNPLYKDKHMNIGQRRFLSVYRKKHQLSRKSYLMKTNEEKAMMKTQEHEPEEPVLHYESLQRNRKERRHPLMITSGDKITMNSKKTQDGIKEVNIKKDFKQQLSLKQNANQLFRLRVQTPIV